MRTVVINTSKAEQNMRFDVLFRIPFGEDQLFWINENLQDLGGCVQIISDRILKSSHFVKKDLNVIVIVDKYSFPYGRYEALKEMYNNLLLLYVRSTLLEPLGKLGLPPKESCLVTVEYATDNNLPLDFFGDVFNNADEQAQEKQTEIELPDEPEENNDSRRRLDISSRKKTKQSKSEDLNGNESIDYQKKLILMKLFGWPESQSGPKVTWDVEIDAAEGTKINFESVFPTIAEDCRKSYEARNMMNHLIQQMLEKLGQANIEKNPAHYEIKCVHDNERDVTIAYFQSLVHVYNCIKQGTLTADVPLLTEDEIKSLFEKAYAKYDYFADENHIPLALEKLQGPYDADALERFSKLTIKLPENASITDPLIMQAFSPEPLNQLEDKRITDGPLDERFANCAKVIADDYTRERIEAQNTEVLMLCMNQYLAWRDEKTVDGLKTALDDANKNGAEDPAYQQDSVAKITGDFELLKKKYEEMRKEDIENIVSVETEPADYENLCHEASVLCAKYDHLCKKGKRYKLAMIGGAVSVAVLFIAYLLYEGVSGWKGLARLPLYLGTLVAFAAAYFCSVSYYIRKIHTEKQDLFDQLRELKKLGEKRRLDSLSRLKNYYEKVMTRAETHSLWWIVVQERYRRNFRLGSLRSEHVKLFSDLRNAVLGFATKMKADVDRAVTFSEKWTDFDVEKSYYEEPNVRYYSFFDVPEKDGDPQEQEVRNA